MEMDYIEIKTTIQEMMCSKIKWASYTFLSLTKEVIILNIP